MSSRRNHMSMHQRCCGQPSLITSFTSWVGWVQLAHKWTESGCQWRLCMLTSTSELTVHMLKCIVRAYVCCPLIHYSSFIHSFIHSFIQGGEPLGGFRQILPQKILKSWCSEMPFLDFWADNFCLKCLLNQLSLFCLFLFVWLCVQ